MEESIRILAVVPYKEMEEMVRRMGAEFPSVVLEVFTGNLENAVKYVEVLPSRNFDIIISRGGTSYVLGKSTSLPIVNIEISAYDMLRAFKLAEQRGGKYAVVGYADIIQICGTLNAINGTTNMDVFEITTENVRERLKNLADRGVDLIVGDVITTQVATSLGLQSILITSSQDSVRKAFLEAIHLYEALRQYRKQTALLMEVADHAQEGIALADEALQIIYANAAFKDLGVWDLRQFMLPLLQLAEQGSLHVIKRIAGRYLDIRAHSCGHSGDPHYIFYIAASKKNASDILGISVYNVEHFQSEQPLIFSAGEAMRPVMKQIEAASSSSAPIFITGEAGTGKSFAARYIHLHGPNHDGPFIHLQCDLLNEKQWGLLLFDPNTLLGNNKCTVFLENIHMLSDSVQQQLEGYLEDTALDIRNRLICSCTCDIHASVLEGKFLHALYDRLYVIPVRLPPLNERIEDIPVLASLLISRFNQEFSKQVVGLDNDALRLLMDFNWKLNLEQFQKVLGQLVSYSDSYYISKEEVARTLADIRNSDAVGGYQPNYSQPLDAIERGIIQHVLAEENMNQTAAARRLGISRSTLWRKLQ